MISNNGSTLYGSVFNDIRCLSTDEKPTDGIKNGSLLTEIDTSKQYLFDAVGKSWNEVVRSGGGEGGSYILPTMSASVKGGARLGNGLSINGDVLSVDAIGTSGIEDEAVTDEKLVQRGGVLEKVDGLESAITGIETLEFEMETSFQQLGSEKRIWFSVVTDWDTTMHVEALNDDYRVAFANSSRTTSAWGLTATASATYHHYVCVKKSDNSNISGLEPSFVKSLVSIKNNPILKTTIEELDEDISSIQAYISAMTDVVKPYDISYSTANLMQSSVKRVCVQTKMPIRTIGKLSIEYYAGTANADLSLLILEKSENNYVIKKIVNTTSTSVGKNVIDMDFTMDGSTECYIGAYEPSDWSLCNDVSLSAEQWGWSDRVNSVSVNNSITISRTINNFLALLPVIESLKVDILDDKIDALQEQINAGKVIRQMAFSFDDTNSVFKDLTTNANTYNSLFENSFFGALKTLHDKYGAKFSCYCFYNVYNDAEKTVLDFSLANCTNKFADEFTENYSWLRFGFHSVDNYTTYNNTITAEQALSDYNAMITELIRITGSVKCIDTCIRTQSFTGTKADCEAWRDALCGINGFLTSDYGETGGSENFQTSTGYYLTTEQYTRCGYKGRYFDPETELFFFPSNLRMDSTSSTNMIAYLNKFNTAIRYNRSHMMIMYAHENQWTNDYPVRIEKACQWALENGYEFIFPMDKIDKIY